MMSEFLLDPEDTEGLTQYLTSIGFLEAAESVLSAGKAGEGNMNCTLRIATSQRTFILKQARPWVEKYPQIPAPVDRTEMEAAFYRETAVEHDIAAHMPGLLRFDPAAHTLMLEDLGGAQDFIFLYQRAPARSHQDDLKTLTSFLAALHSRFRDGDLAARFHNSAMRTLNHEHVFGLPLRPNNGLDLDAITPGLSGVADRLMSESAYVARVAALGQLYLDDTHGCCLIHGDYFPGSWLRSGGKVYVIDPEFCFFGPPEWDLGVMMAHLYLCGFREDFVEGMARLYLRSAKLNPALARQFAGVEMMRRLLGVAQLPLTCGVEEKQALVELSRSFVLAGGGV